MSSYVSVQQYLQLFELSFNKQEMENTKATRLHYTAFGERDAAYFLGIITIIIILELIKLESTYV